MWRYTADLLYILESPAVREGFFPTSEHRYFVEPASAEDWPAIRAIAVGVRTARVGGHLRGLVAPPARTRSGRPATAPAASPGSPRRSSSNGCRARCSTPTRSPGSGATTSGVRRCRAASGSSASAGTWRRPDDPDQALVVAALILNLKRVYMELRPELRRVYNSLPERYGPESPVDDRSGFQQHPRRPA